MEEKKATQPSARFELGCVELSSGVEATLTSDEIACALAQHGQGDWGFLCDKHWEENDDALRLGERMFSVYKTADGGTRFYVITEAGWSSTWVLLPEEY